MYVIFYLSFVSTFLLLEWILIATQVGEPYSEGLLTEGHIRLLLLEPDQPVRCTISASCAARLMEVEWDSQILWAEAVATMKDLPIHDPSEWNGGPNQSEATCDTARWESNEPARQHLAQLVLRSYPCIKSNHRNQSSLSRCLCYRLHCAAACCMLRALGHGDTNPTNVHACIKEIPPPSSPHQ